MLKQGSFGTGLTKVLADCDSVASRTSIKETCADMDRETVVSSLFGSVSKGKRSRPERCENIERQAKSPQNHWEAELAVQEEKLAQQRLYEAEADVEVIHWEKRDSDIAHYEINQEFESQRSMG